LGGMDAGLEPKANHATPETTLPLFSFIDRYSKRMSERTGERGGFIGKERARRLLEP